MSITKHRKKRVAVLRGGPGHYHSSLKTGGHVLKHIKERHDTVDVLIDRDGLWHVGGLPTNIHRALQSCDLVFNCLHGEYGEDGGVQADLEGLLHKYTGSGRLASSVAYDKRIAKERLASSGLRVPEGILVTMRDDPYEVADRLFNNMGGQYVIKPVRGSQSEGVKIIRTQADLAPSLVASLFDHEELLIEQLIHGKEVKVGIVDGLRGQQHYLMLPIEIVKDGKSNAYVPIGGNDFIVPARVTSEEKDVLAQTALEAYKALGLEGYGMVDMILTLRGPVVLEVDTHPTLGEGEPMEESLEALGITPEEFLDHIIAFS